ncbi:MAG: YbdK family carboxylate-amine ligase [Marmoricola sp.]|jgi:carboxylate-amine ligase|nr:YbdK family carboxylate-amine ligase [Marmoricola sp.]
MPVRKVGVEEELMLVAPETGMLTGISRSAVSANETDVEVGEELFLQQIETSTAPCERAEDLLAGLRAGRRAVGEAAAAAGARAVAMATPVLRGEREEFTPTPRYLRIRAGYGELARQSMVCGMHVHVDVASDEEAVRVVDGIRPWLPLLLAVSANSPYWQGRDTGHASWRSQVWNRWPTAGAAQPFEDVATYRAVSEQMIGWGAALDQGMLYFDVRLAERYPTVEIRVADVCTDPEDAVLVALVARALVTTVAADPMPPAWRADLLRVAGWRAARHGLSADLLHPVTSAPVPPGRVFDATVEHVRPALEDAGDLDLVRASFDRVLSGGNGATRQHRSFESTGSLHAVVEDLAARTEASWA